MVHTLCAVHPTSRKNGCCDRIQLAQIKMVEEEAVVCCCSPRKAEGETVPLLRATITLMPVSTNGTEKSMISERSSLIVSEPMAMSARLYTT